MKNKKSMVTGVVTMILFVLLTILISFVDVKVIGSTNKEIGFGSINKKYSYLEYNGFLDKISDIFLFLSLGVVAVFAIIGLFQLIKRKNLFKVDRDIVIFGAFFIALVVFWIVFENFIVINYRPILIDGEAEASYPSTHILLVSFVMLSSTSLIYKFIKNRKVILVFTVISSIMVMTTTVLRLLSGMHWFTDCLGALLLGISLYCFYVAFKDCREKDHN